VFAQEETILKFTVQEAVQYAIENNIELNQSLIDQKIIDAQIAEIKGGALPQINMSGRFTDNYSLAEQQLPAEIVGGEPGTTIGVAFGNRYALSGGFEVTQEIFNFKLHSAIRSAEALKELQTLNTLQTKEDLIINVVRIYIQIQIIEKKIELLNQNFESTNSLVEISKQKLDNGIVKKLDVNQLIVNRTNLSTEIEDTFYTKNKQLRLLKLYLNIPVDSKIELTENLEDQSAYPLQNELTIDSNIFYQQMEQQQKLAIIDEKLVKAEYLPKLNAFFNYNYQGNTNKFEFTGDRYVDQFNGSWGLSASIPVFDGLARRNRLRQKQFATERLAEDKKLLIQNIETNYANALDQIDLSKKQITNQNINMELAEEVYNGSKMSYTEGVAPLTELLDAEFALQQAQSNYLNAVLQFKVSELQYLQSSGQLSKLIVNN
jgi:outer membrane protein TolC